MTNLIKIYDKTCDVCQMLAGIDEEIAEDNGLFFRQFTLSEIAGRTSHIRDYVVSVYVEPNNGMIDVPVYLIETQKGEIQASGIIRNVEELNNLIESWKVWDSSKK